MVFRAVRNFRGKNQFGNGVFHPEEITGALNYLIKEAQQEFYGKEIASTLDSPPFR